MAVVFDAILNREPVPASQLNPALPIDLDRILSQALEKDRDLRFQTATDLKTALKRLKRDLSSGRHTIETTSIHSTRSPHSPSDHSIAVLYFENLSGIQEDEYLRDGITEDITTELSKIKRLKTFSRAVVRAYRDKTVTAGQVGTEPRMFSSEAYVAQGAASGSMLSSSTRRPTSRYGRSDTIARWRTFSPCRTRSPPR